MLVISFLPLIHKVITLVTFKSEFCNVTIGLFHNGDQIKYSFVLMLISLSNFAAMGKIQKNISAKMRSIGLININTKE